MQIFDELHFLQFSEIFHPYMKYCMEEAKCLQYLKTNSNENEKFKTYLKVSIRLHDFLKMTGRLNINSLH